MTRESGEEGGSHGDAQRWPPSVLRAPDASELVPALDAAVAASHGVPVAACPGVVFLIDECVTPLLRFAAAAFGYRAQVVYDLGWGTLKDWELRPKIIERNFTLITNNRDDWRAIVADEEVHPGLVVLIENAPRANEIRYFTRVLLAIAALPDLVNTVVEVDRDGTVTGQFLSKE